MVSLASLYIQYHTLHGPTREGLSVLEHAMEAGRVKVQPRKRGFKPAVQERHSPDKSKGEHPSMPPSEWEFRGNQPDLYKDDFNVLINPKEICEDIARIGKEVFLLITILSSVENRHRRDIIREMYGNVASFRGRVIRRVFLMGESDDVIWRNTIVKEGELQGDIAQFSFRDVYRNLTLKSSCSLAWISKYCKNVRYVLKTDDDIMVFPERVAEFLEKLTRQEERNLYTGHTVTGRNGVIRDESSRWYVPYDIYPFQHFPPYNIGVGILMSKRVVDRFAMNAKKVVRVSPEDVYHGLLAKSIGIKPSCTERIFCLNTAHKYGIDINDTETYNHTYCIYHNIMVSYFIPILKWEYLWKSYIDGRNNNVTCRKEQFAYRGQHCKEY
jgi:hypothetical protein